MATLKDQATGSLITLGVRCLFGRHPSCDVCLNQPRISGEHASLHWVGGAWELRDLGSRNGTFLQDRRLSPGERSPLVAGSTFSLSEASVSFVLMDAGPPEPAARSHATGARRVGSGGLLTLPSDEQPLASIYENSAGGWVAEVGDGLRAVVDRQALLVGTEHWSLQLPRIEAGTWQSTLGSSVLSAVHLRFLVSSDEERVHGTVIIGDRETTLASRSYHYMLVTLARAWLQDEGKPAAQRGWVDREKLCRMLATTMNKLNVDIHRARKQMAALGIHDAAGIVERRPETGEVRIGVRSVDVDRM